MQAIYDLPSNMDYAELRQHEVTKSSLVMVDGNLAIDDHSVETGISARVFKNGYWGFASRPTLDRSNIDVISKKAVENAHAMQRFGSQQKSYFPDDGHVGEYGICTQSQMSEKDRIDTLRELTAVCDARYPDLRSTKFVLREEAHSKWLSNSFGSQVLNGFHRTGFSVAFLSNDKDGRPIEVREMLSSKGSFHDLGLSIQELEPLLDQLHEHLQAKKTAIAPRGGEQTIVMAPQLTGMLAHEAMGHPCEADIVLSGGVTRDKVGEVVASEMITMIDFAHTFDGEEAPIPVYADDEGTKASDAVLIENGVLKQFMTSRETAPQVEMPTTGSARAYLPNDEPLVRMRNTVILPGKDKIEDMIAGVESGYYLMKTSNGEADSTTEFMFSVDLGYEINNGQLGKAITNTTLSGTAINMLQTVDAVSDDMHWDCGGYCGKKQLMVVSLGGPALRAKAHLGGK